jgi:hypothetical protein
MASFDSNQWYHIYSKGNNNTAFMGSSLYNDGMHGTTFFQGANLTKRTQQWQIYAIDSEYYVLRTNDSNTNGFLAAKKDPNANVPSGITTETTRGNITDDGVYWQIKPWGDGYYFMTNKANGSDLHLCDVNTQSAM